MTDFDEWVDWLERWEIHYTQTSVNGITPVIKFSSTTLHFDDDGQFLGQDNEW